MAADKEHIEQHPTPDPEQEARRRLLKLAAYAPPAILGVMIAGTKVAEAAVVPGQTKVCRSGNIVVSASGNACCPCVPGDPKYDPVKCAWSRCSLGSCGDCPPGPYTNSKDCAKVAQACGCACQRTRVGGTSTWNCN